MAYIKKESADKIIDRADLVEVISQFVELKKAGSTYKGLSPFVDERTPSFMVSPAKGIWKCFASGKGGANAVSFLMEKNGWSFPEAIEYLAKKYSIDVEYDVKGNPQQYQEAKEVRQELKLLLAASVKKFQEAFEALPKDHPAKKEVYERRGYTPEIVKAYQIGYAPGQNFITDLCKENGRLNDAMELGLIGKKGDRWVDRVIYPLLDKKGNSVFAVGLAGRRLGENEKYAKWMNSKESKLYQKEYYWYGLDKARPEIVKKREVWIVEGYNDVIGWQINGIVNTVAPCGTAITENQILQLKKYADRIVFCMDQDEAGIRSMLKYIPEFMRQGFRVLTVDLGNGMDPDDYSREHSDLSHLEEAKKRSDGFKFLMDHSFKGKDQVEVAQISKALAELVGSLEDEGMQTIYIEWLRKESKMSLTQLKKWMQREEEVKPSGDNDEFYRLPKEVKTPLSELRKTIERYQLFMGNNKIWVQVGDEPPFTFRSVSNFDISIIQHMQDDKFPTKLVRIRNIHGQTKIFDVPSADMNTPLSFENAVTNHGNFRWRGSRKDHELLKTYLFDQMGSGRKIDVLGWQTEGFFVWNNKVTVPDGQDIQIDENGVFEKDEVSYYVPSANEIYRNNPYFYEGQKKMLCIPAQVTFQNYATQVIKVHREHGITAILFTIASIFQDLVVYELGFFPMLFLYGPASSGKDQLAYACQGFFGKPQTAINLEGGASTMVAQVREFAQFANTISHLSEYKTGDPRLDGVLKGLWDRRGYKRGNINSHVGTESVPILSSVILTGNYSPDQEALITRLMWEFMNKTSFSKEETQEYEILDDMLSKGISSFTEDFLRHRSTVQKIFKNKYREFNATLKQRHPETISRMLSNLSVLGTFYQIFQNIVNFPFSQEEMLDHFAANLKKQMYKMSSSSIINRWWDCFLASMRGHMSDQIRVHRDFKVEDNLLYFNFTSCYNRIQRQWFMQYKDGAPSKSTMYEALQKDEAWVEKKSSVRMDSGQNARNTSAYVMNLKHIGVANELEFAIDFQLSEQNSWSAPATPENFNNEEKNSELPF